MRNDSRVLVAGALVATLCSAVAVWAADSKECKASRKCRGAIVSSASKATSAALKQLDKCHVSRAKGKVTGDCNALDLSGALSKGAGKIGKKCSPDDPVRCRFTNCDPVTTITQALAAAIRNTGETVQGSPNLNGDKQRMKCHKAIGAARSAVARALIKQTVGNQRVQDAAGNCGFPALQETPLTAPSSVAGGQSAKITRACAGLTGADVGSCSPIPECVIDAGEALASSLVVQFYSSPAVCGDEVVTGPNEECDDGNDVDTDGCSNECRLPVCGDNITQTSEECDDDTLEDDECVQCKNARCGDGFLWTENLGGREAEQCDDGNDVADDGCTDCKIDAVSCDPAVGYRVTVAIDYDTLGVDLNSITVDLGYPVGVSIPGSAQDASVQERVTILQPPGEFIALGNDRDLLPPAAVEETLTVGYADLADDPSDDDDGIPAGPQFEVRYDCAEGARFSGEDFTCTVTAASDISSNPIAATCSAVVSAP